MLDGHLSIIEDVTTIQLSIANSCSFHNNRANIVLEPAQFQMTVNKPVQSAIPFDAFFNGGNNVIEIKKPITTPKIAINVKSASGW